MYCVFFWLEIENVFKNGEGYLVLLVLDYSLVFKECI